MADNDVAFILGRQGATKYKLERVANVSQPARVHSANECMKEHIAVFHWPGRICAFYGLCCVWFSVCVCVCVCVCEGWFPRNESETNRLKSVNNTWSRVVGSSRTTALIHHPSEEVQGRFSFLLLSHNPHDCSVEDHSSQILTEPASSNSIQKIRARTQRKRKTEME